MTDGCTTTPAGIVCVGTPPVPRSHADTSVGVPRGLPATGADPLIALGGAGILFALGTFAVLFAGWFRGEVRDRRGVR